MKDRKNHLVLALSQQGLGEAILGLRLAQDLQDAGDSVFFLAYDTNKLLLSETPHLAFGSHVAKLLPIYLANCVAEIRASSIILADYYTTTYFFDQHGLAPEILTRFSLPIFGIDTWDSTRPGDIDVFTNGIQPVTRWSIPMNFVCPVPFLPLHATPTVYSSVPQKGSFSKTERNRLREKLGIGQTDKAILFCSAEWQHAHYSSEAANLLAISLPRLVANYLSNIGKDIHLVHVGPRPFGLAGAMNGRYHWVPPLAPRLFDQVVASTDLLLSANISATTIARAMMHGLPVLVLRNSVSASSREEAEGTLSQPPSSRLARWLDQAVPLFRFLLWPVGYWDFVNPLLQNNLYVNAVEFLEILDEQRIENTLRTLLFDTTARDEHVQRHGSYLAQVRALPDGAQMIRDQLNN